MATPYHRDCVRLSHSVPLCTLIATFRMSSVLYMYLYVFDAANAQFVGSFCANKTGMVASAKDTAQHTSCAAHTLRKEHALSKKRDTGTPDMRSLSVLTPSFARDTCQFSNLRTAQLMITKLALWCTRSFRHGENRADPDNFAVSKYSNQCERVLVQYADLAGQ